MTHKQMKKLAQELYQCELVHSDDNASKEEKTRANNRVMQITGSIMALKNGVSIMMEIDAMVQKIIEQKEKE